MTIKKYRISFDPHANALQHKIVAEELEKLVIANRLLK
jgi:hypothetical protein